MADPQIPEKYQPDFELIEGAAIKGERCPQTKPMGPIRSGAMPALAKAGCIRSEVYSHNFRVVTICIGIHKGKTTSRAPTPGPPYLIMDKAGTRRSGRFVDSHSSKRQEPSPPRLLPANRPEPVLMLRGQSHTDGLIECELSSAASMIEPGDMVEVSYPSDGGPAVVDVIKDISRA